jgi:hypothetical protein
MYLKTVDLREEGATRFFRGPLRAHAYDPASSVVALYLDEVGAAEYGVQPGIHIEPRYGGTPTLVFEGAEHIALSLEWSDTNESFVAGLPNNVILFDREGKNLRVIDQGGVASHAPDGWWLAVYAADDRSPAGVDLYSMSGNLVGRVYDDVVQVLFWAPDSDGFFFVDEKTLYYVTAPEREIWLVEEGVLEWSYAFTWVGAD